MTDLSKILILAELLDELVANGQANLVEHNVTVIVSNLSEANIKKIYPLCTELGCAASIRDNENEIWKIDQITEDLEPFRLTIEKPKGSDQQLFVLTNTGFEKLLLQELAILNWHVARLTCSINTKSILFQPWAGEEIVEPTALLKNPRSLVKEYTNSRTVPADIRPWLLDGVIDLKNPSTSVWANIAARFTLRSICNEIDPENAQLKFKGLPKLELIQDSSNNFIELLGEKAFLELQAAVLWVYENEREAEMRHVLLSNECGRSGVVLQSAPEFISKFIGAALDSARIAYQMSLSETSKDTLKVLADLRKAISEETAKVTDTTRQLASAVTAAIAVGIGLLIVRINTATPPIFIKGIMLVVAIYIATVIFSGVQFISIQKTLRNEWQHRLYRFIPETEYIKLVVDPASRSEKTFFIAALLSGVAILALTGLVIFKPLPSSNFISSTGSNKVDLSSSSSKSQSAISSSSIHAPELKFLPNSSVAKQYSSSTPQRIIHETIDHKTIEPRK